MQKIKDLTKKKFVRNVFAVATGTAAAQAITMLFSPIIARLYGPEAFGVLGVFMSILVIATPIAALTYPIAIVLPKSDAEAKGLIKLSGYISFVMALIITLLIVFYGADMARLLRIEVISPYLLFIPVAMIFAVTLQVSQQWLIRKKQFKIKAKLTVLHAFVLNATKSGIGFFHPVATVLIVLSTFGQALHSVLLAWGSHIAGKGISETKEMVETVRLKDVAKKHYDFPLYRAPQVFVNAVSQGLPILMLTAFFGPASAGFYAIGKKVLGLPTQLIGNSIGDVFYPRIAEAANNKEKVSKLLLKATLLLALVGILPFGLIFIFGPWIFRYVFGADWVLAGTYARWLALWLYFMFANNPSVKTLPVLSAQRFHLMFSCLVIIVRTGALLVGSFVFMDDLMAIILYSSAGAILNLCLILITIKKSKQFDERILL